MASILAQIAGTVSKIETKVGAQISIGDVVMFLESMKMVVPVEAESAGRVAEIPCAEGQTVEEGTVLVVLE